MSKKVSEANGDLAPLRPPDECIVLVVDDEPSVVEIITEFLQEPGYQVVAAENGQQALERVREDNPDLIVTDVNMPEMDGLEFCRQVKDSSETHYLPVIVVTSKSDAETRTQATEAGADDFLDKPVNRLELTTRVRSLLRSKLLYEQLRASKRELEKRVTDRSTELQDAHDQLEELERYKSDVISNVSHELRTPLQHIKSSVSLLTMQDLPQSKADTVRETVNTSVDSLVLLIDDMISLGQGVELRIEPVVLTNIVYEAVDQIQAVHPERAEGILSELDDNLPPVEVDARAIARVLYHLMDNAVKFSEAGSNVLVSANLDSNQLVRVSVKDSGIGISEEDQRYVFERFYQADASPTRRYAGAGVGLALVKLMLDEHDVSYELESAVGEGTTVSFDLRAVELG